MEDRHGDDWIRGIFDPDMKISVLQHLIKLQPFPRDEEGEKEERADVVLEALKKRLIGGL